MPASHLPASSIEGVDSVSSTGSAIDLREPLAALVVGKLEQGLVVLGEQVERDELRGRLLGELLDPRGGRMDALREQVELLDAVDRHDHLAVQHEPLAGERQHELDDVREIAVHRPAVAALEMYLVAVAEDDRPEAVPLRLIAPAVALGQLARGLGELRLDGWREREGQGPAR